MKTNIQHRAEIALRSLPPEEKKQVSNSLDFIKKSDLKKLLHSSNLKKLKTLMEKDLYSFSANNGLRVIFSLHDDECVIEDITTHVF
jgi:plasmid maintenance system killer protein